MSSTNRMSEARVHFEQGAHPAEAGKNRASRPVVLLHSSASTGTQWSALAESLGTERHVIAPDLLGYGQSAESAPGVAATLDREAEAVFALIEPLGEPVDLVGHSFGGAVAVKIAMRWPERVASLAIIEPVLFHLLRRGDAGDRSLLWQIKLLASQMVSSVLDRAPARGMRHFVDFWNGEGTWDRIPEDRKACLVSRTGQVQNNFAAILGEEWDLEDCHRLTCPVLALSGSETAAAARRVTDLLVAALPTAVHHVVEGAGHMSPVTHGKVVNQLIRGHLATVELAALAAEASDSLATAA